MQVGDERWCQGQGDRYGRAVRALLACILDLLDGCLDEAKTIPLSLRGALGLEIIEQTRRDAKPIELKVESAQSAPPSSGLSSLNSRISSVMHDIGMQ